MTVQLRPYQQRVVDSIRRALNAGLKTPCASVATGGGKTWILTTMAQTFNQKIKRCLTLTHVKELVGQLSAAASQIGLDHGVYAASLYRRDVKHMYVIAQIQSVHKRMYDLGKFDVVFVDECHLISDEDSSMYQRALDVLRTLNPDVRVVGLSATPFRMKEGLVYGPGKMFESCVEHVTMRELIETGYLTPLIGKNADRKFDASALHMRGGDFIAGELEDYMADQIKVSQAVSELVAQCADRKRTLVFSSGNKHSRMIVEELEKLGQTAALVNGEMGLVERDAVIGASRSGAVKFLVNCAVLTTGYDDPAIDCVAILRPTRSPGLLLQMAGRGLRLSPGKQSCLILDYGGCLSHFGPLDMIENSVRATGSAKEPGACPTKTCPECSRVIHAARMTCDCGYVWTKKLNHDEKASTEAVMSGMREVAVQRVSYSVQPTKVPGCPTTLRVTYWADVMTLICMEFLSVDAKSHPYAHRKALQWLRDTPTREVEGRLLKVEGSTIRGTFNGTTQDVVDAVSLLPYCKSLESPTHIHVAPDPERPKYARVYRRSFK